MTWTEYTLCEFADDKNLEGVVGTADGCAAIQVEFNRPLCIASVRWEDAQTYTRPCPTTQLLWEIMQCGQSSQRTPN